MSYSLTDPTSCPLCLHRCGKLHLLGRDILVAYRSGMDAVDVPWANREPIPPRESNPYPDDTIETWAWFVGYDQAHMRMLWARGR